MIVSTKPFIAMGLILLSIMRHSDAVLGGKGTKSPGKGKGRGGKGTKSPGKGCVSAPNASAPSSPAVPTAPVAQPSPTNTGTLPPINIDTPAPTVLPTSQPPTISPAPSSTPQGTSALLCPKKTKSPGKGGKGTKKSPGKGNSGGDAGDVRKKVVRRKN